MVVTRSGTCLPYEISHVPTLLLDRNQQIGLGLPLQPRYERICFEREGLGESPRAELLSPDQPLLGLVSPSHRQRLTRMGHGLSFYLGALV